MYDTKLVLAAIDQNAPYILALCGLAMIFNYIYFIDAARLGFKDKVYPTSVFPTLFWLCGDGSVVLDYNLAFNVVNHWYMKLFWGALCLTVAFEILYLYMILRFGRKEIAPQMTQPRFVATVLGALVATFVAYNFIKSQMVDTLVIDYFCLANLAGPMFGLPLMVRRKTRAGTSPLIWFCYTMLVLCWSAALIFFYGKPFASPLYLTLYGVTIAASIVATVLVLSLPPAPKPEAAL